MGGGDISDLRQRAQQSQRPGQIEACLIVCDTLSVTDLQAYVQSYLAVLHKLAPHIAKALRLVVCNKSTRRNHSMPSTPLVNKLTVAVPFIATSAQRGTNMQRLWQAIENLDLQHP